MKPDPSLLWTWNRRVDRATFLATGGALLLVKFAIDWSVARFGFGRSWSPLSYLIWPDAGTFALFSGRARNFGFGLALFAISVPFVWAGVMLTAHRARTVGFPARLLVLFFIPWINLLWFALLATAPDRDDALEAGIELQERRRLLAQVDRAPRPSRERWFASAALAVLASVAADAGLLWFATACMREYGYGLFVGAPFLLGLISVSVFGWREPRSFFESFLVYLSSLVVGCVAILMFGVEGMGCLVMALPLTFLLGVAGAVVGFEVQRTAWARREARAIGLLLLLISPAMMAAEHAGAPEPQLRTVRTEVAIDAPPELVWRNVIAFPPIDAPPRWLFRAGIACPLRAEIRGEGVGAVRECVFTTGTFVEPITAWEPARLLRFDVTNQPPPMIEWSPWHIHPAHLDGYLVSHQGEFRLAPLEDGRTRLEGTTWYTNRMWPEWYWTLWSEPLIHAIHCRVLEHIRSVAEDAARVERSDSPRR